ncbi:MAG: NUDIX hydrolase [Bacteroidia bacterium]|nr:NUDIX hydrolase [Bacteroidia bacterium]
MQWKEISKRTVYENPWIEVSESEVLNPNGKKDVYGKVHYKKETVGIIPVTRENKTILIGQHRFPTQSYSWEIPMGGVEPEEESLIAAKRELKEETGIVADEWVELLNLETSNGITDERVKVYYCNVMRFEENRPDETENLKMQILDFDEVFKMVMNGEIVDAISVAAILKMKILFEDIRR